MPEMVTLGKGYILMLVISLVHLSVWSTGTCGDTAEGMLALRLRGRRGNYLPQPRHGEIILGARILSHSALLHSLFSGPADTAGKQKAIPHRR